MCKWMEADLSEKKASKHKKHSSPLILINNLNFHHIPSLFIHHLQILYSLQQHSIQKRNWLLFLPLGANVYDEREEDEQLTRENEEVEKKHSPPVNRAICHNYFLCCYFFFISCYFSILLSALQTIFSCLRLTFFLCTSLLVFQSNYDNFFH
jgi:hypothetical protein